MTDEAYGEHEDDRTDGAHGDEPFEDRVGDDEAEAFAEDEPGAHGQIDAEALLALAYEEQTRIRAYWHVLPKEIFAFLFANCLFVAGVIAVWMRAAPGVAGDPSTYIDGLDTIRGALIFGIALYGFWVAVFNIWGRQMKIWPYLIAALLALWVGVGGFTRAIGGRQWDQAIDHIERLKETAGATILDEITIRLSVVAPGYWCLTIGGVVVLFVLVMSVMTGAQKAKARAS